MVAVQATIFLFVANAQSKVNEGCDLKVFGVSDSKEFLQFDKELRSALLEDDAAKMALLLDYPLRVNDDSGGYLIANPASFDGHFENLFPPSLRKRLASEPFGKLWCSYRGITYSDGLLWVQPTDRGYRIQAINVESPKQAFVPHRKVELVCRTNKFRAIVDVKQNSTESRLRIWNVPHLLDSKPDETLNGVESFEGTGPCAHALWKFDSGDTVIEFDDLQGCSASDNPSPQGTVGQITYTDSKGQETSSWCY